MSTSQDDSSWSYVDSALRHWLPSPVGGNAQGGLVLPLTLTPTHKAKATLIQNTEFPCRNDLVQRKTNFPNAEFLWWLNNFRFFQVGFAADSNNRLTPKYKGSVGVGGGGGRLWKGQMLGPFPLVNHRWPSYFSPFLGGIMRGLDTDSSRDRGRTGFSFLK